MFGQCATYSTFIGHGTVTPSFTYQIQKNLLQKPQCFFGIDELASHNYFKGGGILPGPVYQYSGFYRFTFHRGQKNKYPKKRLYIHPNVKAYHLIHQQKCCVIFICGFIPTAGLFHITCTIFYEY